VNSIHQAGPPLDTAAGGPAWLHGLGEANSRFRSRIGNLRVTDASIALAVVLPLHRQTKSRRLAGSPFRAGADFEKPLGTRLCAARAHPLSCSCEVAAEVFMPRRGQVAGLLVGPRLSQPDSDINHDSKQSQNAEIIQREQRLYVGDSLHW
jgi:hypothetical protein